MRQKSLLYIFLGTGVFLLLIPTAFILFSLFQGPETHISESLTIEAPIDVVWNNVYNFEEHTKWMRDIVPLYNYNHSARQIRYNIGDRTLMANQQVRIRKNAYSIDFIRIGHERYSEINDLHGAISLHALADGATEIKWQINYSLQPFSARVLNALFVQPKLHLLLQHNIRALKSYIEH